MFKRMGHRVGGLPTTVSWPRMSLVDEGHRRATRGRVTEPAEEIPAGQAHGRQSLAHRRLRGNGRPTTRVTILRWTMPPLLPAIVSS